MSARAGSIARRYARALFEVASQNANLEEVRRQLEEAAGTLQNSAELRGALEHPGVPPDKKRKIVMGLWREGLVARLLALVAERGRVALLPTIVEEFEKAWNESRGVVSANVVSAVALGTAELDGLEKAIAAKLGSAVDLKARVDASLLGGLRLSVGGRTYDGSVRTRLRNLKERLAAGAA
jgi:F-type H+-transporting ATPase subunit delta